MSTENHPPACCSCRFNRQVGYIRGARIPPPFTRVRSKGFSKLRGVRLGAGGVPHAGGGQDLRVHQARVDAHHIGPGIHGDPVRDTAAVPAAVGFEGLIAPHVDVGGRIGGEHANPLRRVVAPQGAVTPAYRAVAIIHLHRRGIDLQDDSTAVARRSYHPLAPPSIDADPPRVYNPTLLLFTRVRGRGIRRISPRGGSRKSDPAVPSEARGARVGRTAQNSTPKIYLSVVAPPPVPQYHRRHPNGRRQ